MEAISICHKGGTLMANPSLIGRLTVTKTEPRVASTGLHLAPYGARNQLAISGHSGCKVPIFNSIVAQCEEAFQ